MLRLARTEPAWLELFPATGDEPAVEVQFAPVTMPAVRAARAAVRAAYREDAADNEGAGDALSRELIRRGLLAWRGIGDEDGVAIEVTPETIEAFIADPRTFEAADRVYVLPWCKRDAEGNVSSGSPNGIGEPVTPESGTATSPAVPETAPDARPAPTGSKSRRRTKG